MTPINDNVNSIAWILKSGVAKYVFGSNRLVLTIETNGLYIKPYNTTAYMDGHVAFLDTSAQDLFKFSRWTYFSRTISFDKQRHEDR